MSASSPVIYLIFFYVKLKLILSTGGIAALCLAPPDPLSGYAGRWYKKVGSPDAPRRISSVKVQVQSREPIIQPIKAIAEP